MSGLIDSTAKLSYGTGLRFEPGLGSSSLDNRPAVGSNPTYFNGAGNMSIVAVIRSPITVRFSGSGGLAA